MVEWRFNQLKLRRVTRLSVPLLTDIGWLCCTVLLLFCWTRDLDRWPENHFWPQGGGQDNFWEMELSSQADSHLSSIGWLQLGAGLSDTVISGVVVGHGEPALSYIELLHQRKQAWAVAGKCAWPKTADRESTSGMARWKGRSSCEAICIVFIRIPFKDYIWNWQKLVSRRLNKLVLNGLRSALHSAPTHTHTHTQKKKLTKRTQTNSGIRVFYHDFVNLLQLK